MARRLLSTLLLGAAFPYATCHEDTPAAATTSSGLTAGCVIDHCQVDLSTDLTLRYRIHLPDDYHEISFVDAECTNCKISVQLVYDGFTWLGIGWNPNATPQMIGTRAIIGQPNVQEPTMYHLDQKNIDSITAVSSSEARLEDTSIEYIEGETIMEFTVPFRDWELPLPVVANNNMYNNHLYTFLWAHGNDGESKLSYHGPGNKALSTIENFMGLHYSEAGANSMTLQEKKTSKAAWLAHGLMAFIAFGILVPMALVAALLRDVSVEPLPLPTIVKAIANKISEKWLYIHVGLNTLSYTFILAVFSVAVSMVSIENNDHWYHGHNKLGLGIFIFVTFQVLGGYFRPSDKKPTDGNDAEQTNGGAEKENRIGVIATPSLKSSLRQSWELVHHLLGLALFIFGMWQMYGGMELYHGRYGTGSMAGIAIIYIVWMAFWTMVIVGGMLYKYFWSDKTNSGGSGVERSGGKEKEQPGVEMVGDVADFT